MTNVQSVGEVQAESISLNKLGGALKYQLHCARQRLQKLIPAGENMCTLIDVAASTGGGHVTMSTSQHIVNGDTKLFFAVNGHDSSSEICPKKPAWSP